MKKSVAAMVRDGSERLGNNSVVRGGTESVKRRGGGPVSGS